MYQGLLASFCDNYCRYPYDAPSQNALDFMCDSCPIVKFFSQAEHSQPEKGVSGNATEREE